MLPKSNPARVRLLSSLLLIVTACVCDGLNCIQAAPGDSHWDRQFAAPGTGSYNYALKCYGNKIFAGGISLYAGQVHSNVVVSVYDGTNWSILEGITGSPGVTVIYDFTVISNNLYVGGIFRSAGGEPAVGLARWSGTNWSGVGGFSGAVTSLDNDGTNLFVGGSFTNCGGVFATNIAKWNGTSWASLGGGLGYYDSSLNLYVAKVLWKNGELYAGGRFTNSASLSVSNLARWDGSNWSSVGGGVRGISTIVTGGSVTDLDFIGNDLYVAGAFFSAGSLPATNIAKWNGSVWSVLGSGVKCPPNNEVGGIGIIGSDVYAAGGFTNAGGFKTDAAKWNGASWTPMGVFNGSITEVESGAGNLYLAGGFTTVNFDTTTNIIGNNIIRWNGSNWQGISGKGANGTHLFVQALASGTNGIYVGGFFNAVGNSVARRIARWNGTNWFPLGSGVDGLYNSNSLAVRAIATRNNEVFAGGAFVSAGGVTANNVARWDGANWSSLGYGVDSTVTAIATTPTDVYVGGGFTNAYNAPFSGPVVNRIARWNASTGWSSLGSGMNGSVNVLRESGGLIYAGGTFTTSGGVTANRIAVWNGSTWSSLGSGSANGVGGNVSSILVDGGDVYVGGSFTTAGGATARAIAKWNGSSWSALGQGIFHTSTASVTSLEKMGSYIYVSGLFTNAGGSVVTRNIARWNGTQWEALGSGLGNESAASRGTVIVASGNDLFVGGIFETVGEFDSGYFGRWNDQIDFAPQQQVRLINPQMLGGNAFKFVTTASERANYIIEHSSDLTSWVSLTTNSSTYQVVTNIAPGVDRRAYRARKIP